jgi:predicted membrane-bound mannosyltransferase
MILFTNRGATDFALMNEGINMTQIEILILFALVVALFIAASVYITTKSKTKNADNLAFNNIVYPKLLQLYGVPAVINGVNVIVLPAPLKQTIDQYLAR